MSELLENQFFSTRLIGWYQHHKRDLPWRHTHDPYYIWLSEIILQQTRVTQGLPYYLRFVEAYPTVFDLAQAPEQEVLRLWQGLGYYTRARNLHHTAKHIAQELGGKFPNTYDGLRKLKGIGTYTAAAIASFAFNEPVAVLDGNVYRVLSRIFGIFTDIASPAAQKEFLTLANTLIPTAQPALFNQAIMEFGAVQCTPTSPDCLLCPFQAFCYANATGSISQLPVKSKKAAVRERYFQYLVFVKGQKIAMRQRNARDIWQGLYDFCLVETSYLDISWEEMDLPLLPSKLSIFPPTHTYTHVLTHQRIQAKFWKIEIPEDEAMVLPSELAFFDHDTIEELPKPVLIETYWKEQFL